jgi:hypothetical protein
MFKRIGVCARIEENAMSIPIQSRSAFGKRFGLAPDAIFRLWKSALKDDESLIDEAIAATYAAHSRTERSARAADARAPKPDFAPAKSGGGVLAAKASCLPPPPRPKTGRSQ